VFGDVVFGDVVFGDVVFGDVVVGDVVVGEPAVEAAGVKVRTSGATATDGRTTGVPSTVTVATVGAPNNTVTPPFADISC
jgi:hypothetical protein